MKKSLLFIVLVLLCFVFPLNAQMMNYQYSTSSASFTPITGASSLTLIGTTPLDEGYSAAVPIGFNFTYAGAIYDSFQVSTNGFIRLGSGLTSPTATNALAGTLRRIIAPLWDDLSIADAASLTYVVTGTSPNRVLTVEWRNVKWLAAATTANAEFQLRLFEGSNRVEFHYGTFGAVLATVSASIGLSDNTTVGSVDQATRTFLSLQLGGDALSRTFYATSGLEFKTVFLAPDNNTVVSFNTPGAPLSGTYTVGGTTPDFPTISRAANALNSRGVSGAVTMNVRPGTYEDVLHLVTIPGVSAANTVTFRNVGGVVTLSPRNGGRTGNGVITADAVIRLDGSRFVTIDGINVIENPLNNTTALKFEMGVVFANSVANSIVTSSARFNVIKNLSIDMNAQTGIANNNAIGVRFGTAGSNIDSTLTNSYNTIQDVVIEDYWRAAVFAYGFAGAVPDVGNKVTAVTGRNTFGNVNITTGTALDVRSIELNAQFDFTIEKTDIKDIIVNNSTFTTNSVYAIRMNPAAGTDHNGGTLLIQDLRIFNLELQNAAATTGMALGIEINRVAPNTQIIIRNCSISDLFSNGATGRAEGILINAAPQAGFNAFATVSNNLIFDVRAPRSTTVPSVRGMDYQSTAGNFFANAYYNTIFIDDAITPTAATHESAGIYWTLFTTSTLDLRNNIVVNGMGSVTRASVLYAASNANLLRLAPTSNNNLYFAFTPSTTKLIAYDGATSFQTLAAFKAGVATGGVNGMREALSVTEDPPFVGRIAPYNLSIMTTVPTQIESGAQPITGITSDFVGTTRSISFPDIGAYEFSGVRSDNIPPAISFVALTPTHITTNRQLVAAITDPSGVASGSNSPRLYYRKSVNDPYIFDAAPAVSGSNYTFTINYSLLPGGSISSGDTIFYYVAAQDINGFAVTNPAGGSGANPPGTTAVTVPRTYTIIPTPLKGTYTISAGLFNRISGRNVEPKIFERTVSGSAPLALNEEGLTTKDGQPIEQLTEATHVEQYEVLYENGLPYRGSRSLNATVIAEAKSSGLLPLEIESVYPSIAAAVTDLNLRGVSAHTTFLLPDTGYVTPTVQVLITNDSVSTANRTVTFRPSPNVNTTIWANSTSPVFIIANSYFILDGSNVVNGTTRNMSIINTNTGASAGVAFFSASHYSIVRNIIGMGATSAAGYGLVFDNSTYGTITNNAIRRTTLGIQLQANSNFTKITNNVIGAALLTEKIQNIGVAVLSSNDFEISGNLISGLLRTATSSTAGIVLGIVSGGADVKNGLIFNNTINDIKHTGVGLSAYAAYGVRLSGNIFSSNISIHNNVLSDIWGDGDASIVFNPAGIYISQGGGYNIYFNSINLWGQLGYSGTSAAATACIVINSVITNNLNIRNNILQNAQTIVGTLGKTYALYSSGTNAAFSDINYNNYYSIGEDAGFAILWPNASNDLAAWKLATGKDANSKAVNPMYTDSLNLRPLAGSGVLFAGTPITGITTDITGSTRTNTPTMGAYEYPIVNIGWANLQWPGTATIPMGGSVTVYGQIWIDGVTNQPGAGVGIKVWVGYNSSNTNPNTWTNWVQATYNVDSGNNDEYMASIGSTLASGTYYYATRYQMYDGAFYYAGFGGGNWNGTSSVSGVLTVLSPIVVDWQRSAGTTTLPTWFGTGSTERGLAWGLVNVSGQGKLNRVIVPTRNGGTFVKVLNDSTGADVSDLNVTGIEGGTFVINDAEVDHLGRIYVCNLSTNISTGAFKVYRWDNTSSVPKVVLSYMAGADAIRLGDNFSVSYDAATQGYAVWAASATTGFHRVYKFTQIVGSDSLNQVPTVITLSDNITTGIASASVGPLQNGSFYWNATGQNARKYSANGTLIGVIPTAVLGTGSNAIKLIGTQGTTDYVATVQFGTGNNNARVIEVPNGDPTTAVSYGVTTPLGANANTVGGDVAVKMNMDGTASVFVLATNNGLGSYRMTRVIPVEFSTFSAEAQDRNVMLVWKTATETNSASFEVERTLSGTSSWAAIGSVRAAGTSVETKSYSYLDRNLNSAKYQYRLRQIDLDGSYSYSSVVEVEVGMPVAFGLSQNYPNPFNPTTRIEYQIPADSRVSLELYDITGQRVATLVNTEMAAGYHTFDLSVGSYGLASGVYIYRMTAVEKSNGRSFVNTKKMMMLK